MRDSYVFQIPKSGTESYYLLVGPYLWEKFSFVELTEIMRQKDDQKFAVASNNFANCTLTEEDNVLFLSRQFGKESFTAIDSLAGNTGSEITDKFRDSLKQLKVFDTQGLP